MDEPAKSSAQNRLSAIEDQLQALRRQVTDFAGRLSALESHTARPAETGQPAFDSGPDQADGSLLTHSLLLRRVATISFVLVLALALRTLTDSGAIDRLLGVWLGIGYAMLLFGVGWRRLVGDRPGKRVFPICGAVLLCSLVLEAYSRFAQLSASSAVALLVATLVITAALGLRYRTPAIAEAGSLAAAITVVAIGFPTPQFHLAAAVLVLAMLVSVAVARQRRVAWLHWLVFALLSFFWLLWSFKLAAPLARGEALPVELRIDWFVPALALTFATLLAAAFAQSRVRASAFWLALPSCNVSWALAAAGVVLVHWLGADRWLGVVALLVAGLHLLLAERRARAGPVGAPAAAGLVIAAMIAFVPASWLATGSLWLVLPAWSLAAYGVAQWSDRLGSGSLRGCAVLLQVGTTIAAIAAGVFVAPPGDAWASAALGAALATLACLHYRWTLTTPPATTSWYGQLMPQDRPGVVVLWAAVAAAFGCLRVLSYLALTALPIDIDSSFAAAQSVLLSAAAITMLIVAQRLQSRPVLGTAVLVGVLCAIKVFASDFLTLRGVPLVVSVFSFGMAAALASLIVGRWQRTVHEPTA